MNSWLLSPILLTSSCYTQTAVANFSRFLTKMGRSLPQVAADDLDQGQNGQVTYSIRSSSMSGLFKIDPLTGSITTAAIMDREIWTQTKWVLLFLLVICSSSHVVSPQVASALYICMFKYVLHTVIILDQSWQHSWYCFPPASLCLCVLVAECGPKESMFQRGGFEVFMSVNRFCHCYNITQVAVKLLHSGYLR